MSRRYCHRGDIRSRRPFSRCRVCPSFIDIDGDTFRRRRTRLRHWKQYRRLQLAVLAFLVCLQVVDTCSTCPPHCLGYKSLLGSTTSRLSWVWPNAMFYSQQSPAVTHKHPNHQDQSPWSRTHHPVLGPPGSQNIGPSPASPGYALYTNGSVNPMQHHTGHPHALPHAPIAHHQHHNSLSHYPSPPNGHMHSQHMGQASPGSAASQIITPHWQQQLLKCEVRVFISYTSYTSIYLINQYI